MKILELEVVLEEGMGRKSEGEKDEGESGRRGDEVVGRVQSLRWESDESVVNRQDENGAKETARGVCRWVLGVELCSEKEDK